MQPGTQFTCITDFEVCVQNNRREKKWVLSLDSAAVIQPLRSRSPDRAAGEMTAGMALSADGSVRARVTCRHGCLLVTSGFLLRSEGSI